MAGFAVPRLFVSKCLGFGACRWDGVTITDDFIESLRGCVEFVTACPETEIGLGVPRDPIRIVSRKGTKRLVQPATGRDVSREMKSFARKFLGSLGEVDGFILKDRSPSCGINNVKAYRSAKSSAPFTKTCGFFAAEVLRRFPNIPIDTEKRLSNRRIRERFLARAFALSGLRQRKKAPRFCLPAASLP